MNIIILGTTPFTIECIKTFLAIKWNIKCIISLPKENCPANSVNLEIVAKEYGILYYETNDINSKETETFLLQFHIDYIFSTWPYIIKKNILQIPKYYVIGSHPTHLPYNRGRHPLHWLICLGIKNSYMSLFIMDEGVDSGNILIQEKFNIKYEHGINDVYENMIGACNIAITKLCTILENNPIYEGTCQEVSNVNYWRKKDIFDVIIDFRMNAIDIVRLVKSFNRPYDCAVLLFEDNFLRIEDSNIEEEIVDQIQLERLEPGKIIQIKENSLYIKASDKVVRLDSLNDLHDIHFKNYIHPPVKYIMNYYDFFQNLL